jgi:hypothetical protein
MRKSDELFPGWTSTTAPTAEETASLLDALLDGTLSLSLPHRRHTALAAQALVLINSIYAERWLQWENPGTTVPPPFIFLLVFWLFLIFLSFGLFASSNLTVITRFVLSALTVTGALFLILELGDPMEGWPGLRRTAAPCTDRDRPSLEHDLPFDCFRSNVGQSHMAIFPSSRAEPPAGRRSRGT